MTAFRRLSLLLGAAACAAMLSTGPRAQEPEAPAPLVSAEQFERWLTELSNWGRFGPDDELGMANLITPAKRAEAAALVTEGHTVSLASNAQNYRTADVPCPVEWSMSRATRTGASDTIAYPCIHGPGTTHLDAFAHVFFDGKMWNGYDVDGLVTMEDGALKNSIMAVKDGLVTRGVLYGHPAAQGRAVARAGDPHHRRGPRGVGGTDRGASRPRRRVPHPLGPVGPAGRPGPVRHRRRGGRDSTTTSSRG